MRDTETYGRNIIRWPIEVMNINHSKLSSTTFWEFHRTNSRFTTFDAMVMFTGNMNRLVNLSYYRYRYRTWKGNLIFLLRIKLIFTDLSIPVSSFLYNLDYSNHHKWGKRTILFETWTPTKAGIYQWTTWTSVAFSL